MRNYRSTSFSAPTCRRVNLKDLRTQLPPETQWIDASQRRHDVERRRPAILRLYRG
jgi:hypothetical protein